MTEQRLTIRAELARRMGWKWFTDDNPEHDGTMWLSTPSLMAKTIRQYPTVHETEEILPIDWKCVDIPDPFTDAADNRALIEWLAADDARWKQFDDRLLMALSLQPLPAYENGNSGFQRMLRRQFLTASLETITLAAARALDIPVDDPNPANILLDALKAKSEKEGLPLADDVPFVIEKYRAWLDAPVDDPPGQA